MTATLTIHSMPGTGRLPTVSPFSLKLETWLRMVGVPYEHQDAFFHQSPSGRLPFAEHGSERITDSSRIIAYAKKTWGVDPDAHLGPAERALTTLLGAAFEDFLYFARSYDQFVVEENYLRAKAYVAAFLPEEQREIATAAMRVEQLEKLRRQGVALLSTAEVHERGMAIIDAAAHALGDKPFFCGDQATTIDAVVYGFLATQVRGLVDSPISERVKGHANLMDFVGRIDARYWA